jgi:uncharacterized membrane protein
MQLQRMFHFLTRGLAATAVFSLLALPTAHAETTKLATQDQHLVSPAQLQQQVQTTSNARQQNIDTLTQFLSTSQAVQVMKSHNIDPAQVKHAIPTLSDAELADLSARAAHAQHDFAAGILGIDTLLLIILILVIVIVIAVVH